MLGAYVTFGAVCFLVAVYLLIIHRWLRSEELPEDWVVQKARKATAGKRARDWFPARSKTA
jgi:hypothetical protein